MSNDHDGGVIDFREEQKRYKRINGRLIQIGEQMEVTVERVSEFGIMVNEKWMNGDKKLGIKFKDGDKPLLHAGDVVDITTNTGGFITAYKVVTSAPPKAPWKGSSKPYTAGKTDFRTPEQIMRSVAVEAVFGSPLVSELLKDKSTEEATALALNMSKAIALYIEGGN